MFSVDPWGSWNGLPLLLSQTTLDESDKRSDNLAQMNRQKEQESGTCFVLGVCRDCRVGSGFLSFKQRQSAGMHHPCIIQ